MLIDNFYLKIINVQELFTYLKTQKNICDTKFLLFLT